jgi:hypothetical protein
MLALPLFLIALAYRKSFRKPFLESRSSGSGDFDSNDKFASFQDKFCERLLRMYLSVYTTSSSSRFEFNFYGAIIVEISRGVSFIVLFSF